MQRPIQRVKFTKAIARHTKIRDQNPSLGYTCPGEPHQRSPNAPKFEDRSLEETEWQELGAREAAWKLAKNVFKLKEHEKAAFFSSPENRCHLAWRAMLLLEVVEPVAFDAQIPLFLRFVVRCSYLRAVCMVSCRWDKRGRRSAAAEEGPAARRLHVDGWKRSRNETSCRRQVSSSVGEVLSTGSESSPACALAGIRPKVGGPSPWQAENKEVEAEISSQSRAN